MADLALSDALYTTQEAATALRIAAATLNRWRTTGEGPVFVRVGRRVYYRQSEIETYLSAGARRHTHEAA
jgi:predicted site-specific integrase-resolvase